MRATTSPLHLLVITHDARRQNELARYGHGTAGRPTTSNVRTRRTATDTATDDRFKRVQTANGVFIAAEESSWGWLTSYDLLRPVKLAPIPKVFPVSDIRHDGDGAEGQSDRPDDDPANVDSSGTNDGAANAESGGKGSAAPSEDPTSIKDPKPTKDPKPAKDPKDPEVQTKEPT
jgi:hypothetical protein